MYGAGLSLCSAMQLPTALSGQQMLYRAMLCSPQMPDRGGAVRPTHGSRHPHEVGGRARKFCSIEGAE
ncbi:hypothetical protein Y032_0003g1292 [Ancylostoma ceylanicum]|uniref:Uncharacterized protein n=1 Tax=Ancylostoma ceylanicum TaxID=53326 RepID=A0A016VWU8_9BILA|nr:hypothetical protein Y032_0003g1292 [Ancylostoma ceylanicum]